MSIPPLPKPVVQEVKFITLVLVTLLLSLTIAIFFAPKTQTTAISTGLLTPKALIPILQEIRQARKIVWPQATAMASGGDYSRDSKLIIQNILGQNVMYFKSPNPEMPSEFMLYREILGSRGKEFSPKYLNGLMSRSNRKLFNYVQDFQVQVRPTPAGKSSSMVIVSLKYKKNSNTQEPVTFTALCHLEAAEKSPGPQL